MEEIKNVVGKDGIINLTGEIGSPAKMYKVEDSEFWDNIEEGIKSTVKVIIDNGFKTYSSCQGHINTEYNSRSVTVILQNHEVEYWLNFINYLNNKLLINSKIEFLLVPKQNNITNLFIKFGKVENIDYVNNNQQVFNENLKHIKNFYK